MMMYGMCILGGVIGILLIVLLVVAISKLVRR